jgi:ATP-dependent DNA helicase RecQ
VLRTLRKARRGKDEVIITPGEILRDDDCDLDLEDRNVDTKVRTAVAWLERAGFLQRDENVTSVFQATLLVKSLSEAEEKMLQLNLSQTERGLWLAIVQRLMNSRPDESLTVDQLALLPELGAYLRGSTEALAGTGGSAAAQTAHDFLSGKILKILRAMAEGGLLKRDTRLTAFVHYKIANHSGKRLERAIVAERTLLDLLATNEPDPEGWMRLSLVLLNQQLIDEGVEISPEAVRLTLASISQDGRGFAGSRGSIELRYAARDVYLVKVNRSWTAIGSLAEKRRRIAELALDVILAKIPSDTPASADLLVSFSFEELIQAINEDLLLRSEILRRNWTSRKPK